jgi:hypothetical protein
MKLLLSKHLGEVPLGRYRETLEVTVKEFMEFEYKVIVTRLLYY